VQESSPSIIWSISVAIASFFAVNARAEKRKEAKEVAAKTVYVDLLVDVEFMEEYSMALYIPGAKEYFPTYAKNYI
jgi:uncharacterized 2Fe-2S/4Fe-4S cluster protein (DUF4445 family)